MEDQGDYRFKGSGYVYKSRTIKNQWIKIDEEMFNVEEPREGYGAYITHDILNNDQLNDRQKVLYARIHNLTNKKGYCFASNEWFSTQMKTSIPTIKRDLKLLRDQNLIHQVMKETETGSIRLIYLGGGQLTGDLRGQLTGDPHNIIERNRTIPGLEKKPGNDPIKDLIAANEFKLRFIPKTVYGKKVTLKEVEWVLTSMTRYNDVRAHRLGKLTDPKYRGLSPCNKACSQLIVLFRDDPDIMESWYATIENMFNAQTHKENHWQWLTPEFISRKTKYDIYYNAGSQTDN